MDVDELRGRLEYLQSLRKKIETRAVSFPTAESSDIASWEIAKCKGCGVSFSRAIRRSSIDIFCSPGCMDGFNSALERDRAAARTALRSQMMAVTEAQKQREDALPRAFDPIERERAEFADMKLRLDALRKMQWEQEQAIQIARSPAPTAPLAAPMELSPKRKISLE